MFTIIGAPTGTSVRFPHLLAGCWLPAAGCILHRHFEQAVGFFVLNIFLQDIPGFLVWPSACSTVVVLVIIPLSSVGESIEFSLDIGESSGKQSPLGEKVRGGREWIGRAESRAQVARSRSGDDEGEPR